MELEDFKYFVLNTVETWQTGFCESIRIHQDGQISLWPQGGLASFPDMGQATGFAVDGNSNLYIIDADNCFIYKYLNKTSTFQRTMCIGGCGYAPGQFNFGFQETSAQYLGALALAGSVIYVADTFNHRIQSFYLRTFQIRSILGATEEWGQPITGNCPGEFNSPRELLTDSKKNLYVLDYKNERIQKFDKYDNYLYSLGDREPGALIQPENMSIDKNDFIYVLDAGKRCIVKFDDRGRWLADLFDFDDPEVTFEPSGLAIDQDSFIYLGENGNKVNQKIHVFDHSGRHRSSFGTYSGTCKQILIDANGNVYASCGTPGKIFLFHDKEEYSRQGVYLSKMFDSTKDDCRWHRLVFDGKVPDKTSVDIYSFASNVSRDVKKIQDKEWTKIVHSPHNSLISNEGLVNEEGRYLWLKISMIGDLVKTPMIKTIKLYFERQSYLRYLPATFQENKKSKDLLERYLSLFESLSYDMEQQIRHITEYLDPQAIDKNFINWLASWLGIASDENWPLHLKRALIERAYGLYKIRGTLKGLKEIVMLFTGQAPLIFEHFRLKNPAVVGTNSAVGISTIVGQAFTKRLVLEESSTIGDFVLQEDEDLPEKPFLSGAFDITIQWNISELENEPHRNSLERFIQEEKPAHTRCFIRVSDGLLKLGYSFLEIDTKIGKGFEMMSLGDRSRIGVNSFVGLKNPIKGTVGIRSNISVDTLLH